VPRRKEYKLKALSSHDRHKSDNRCDGICHRDGLLMSRVADA